MADSGAARNRRYRKHRAGDHSLCRHDARSGSQGVAAALLASPDGDSAEIDARVALVALARRLEAAHVAAPDAWQLARELRACLLVLLPAQDDDAEPDFVAELAKLALAVP
jgi:hypothetical protein